MAYPGAPRRLAATRRMVLPPCPMGMIYGRLIRCRRVSMTSTSTPALPGNQRWRSFLGSCRGEVPSNEVGAARPSRQSAVSEHPGVLPGGRFHPTRQGAAQPSPGNQPCRSILGPAGDGRLYPRRGGRIPPLAISRVGPSWGLARREVPSNEAGATQPSSGKQPCRSVLGFWRRKEVPLKEAGGGAAATCLLEVPSPLSASTRTARSGPRRGEGGKGGEAGFHALGRARLVSGVCRNDTNSPYLSVQAQELASRATPLRHPAL
jgi:hypothetical protein